MFGDEAAAQDSRVLSGLEGVSSGSKGRSSIAEIILAKYPIPVCTAYPSSAIALFLLVPIQADCGMN